jgi:hypothetical protein
MPRFAFSLAAALVGSAASAAAQDQYQQQYPQQPQYEQQYQQPYQQPYQQQYPDQYQQQYPQPYPGPQQGYGYPDQQYGNQNIVGSFIDQLIGNRYDVSDRQAIRRCGYAAVQEAENRYRPYFNGMPYAFQGYRSHVRVSDLTSVQRRLLVTRVKGYLDTTRRGNRDWNRRDRGDADLSFRCDVDRRGNVSDVRIERTRFWRN